MRLLKMLVLSGFMVMSCASSAFSMGDAGFVQQTLVGKKAIDFTLDSFKNQKINLMKSINGKKAIIVFWATWCPHCRVALKEIDMAKQELIDNNIVVIFISTGEPASVVGRYLDNNGYNFDVAMDVEQSVSDAYRLLGVPTLIYIDENAMIKSVEYQFSTDFKNIYQ